MEAISIVALVALGLSVACNIYLALSLKRSGRKPKPTLTAEQLLHDLTHRGAAMVRLEVIDPTHLFLRSPKT